MHVHATHGEAQQKAVAKPEYHLSGQKLRNCFSQVMRGRGKSHLVRDPFGLCYGFGKILVNMGYALRDPTHAVLCW